MWTTRRCANIHQLLAASSRDGEWLNSPFNTCMQNADSVSSVTMFLWHSTTSTYNTMHQAHQVR